MPGKTSVSSQYKVFVIKQVSPETGLEITKVTNIVSVIGTVWSKRTKPCSNAAPEVSGLEHEVARKRWSPPIRTRWRSQMAKGRSLDDTTGHSWYPRTKR
jgi:hypothetical protein